MSKIPPSQIPKTTYLSSILSLNSFFIAMFCRVTNSEPCRMFSSTQSSISALQSLHKACFSRKRRRRTKGDSVAGCDMLWLPQMRTMDPKHEYLIVPTVLTPPATLAAAFSHPVKLQVHRVAALQFCEEPQCSLQLLKMN